MLTSISYATGADGRLVPIKVDANGEAWVPLPDAFVAKAKALAASGNLTVHLDTRAGFTSIEVVCPSGFRQRAALIDGLASLDSLPAASCVANFKGGPPARFAPLSAGTWRCQYTGTTMSCAKP